MIENLKTIFKDDIVKIIVSNPKSSTNKYIKIVYEKVKDNYRKTCHSDKQVFHSEVLLNNIENDIVEELKNFKNANLFSLETEYTIKISKKGKVFIGKSSAQPLIKISDTHNRKKNYLLSEGLIPPLIDLGVFTKEGKIVQSKYQKYKQINRFLELVDDCVNELELKTINVLDFGCGKSYLTFILYYYFTEIKNIEVNMIGLDLKEDVINNCNKIADKYGYKNLKFIHSDIQNYIFDKPVDIVITLHACDTATDYALYNAVKWDAKAILSVPCCQHELNFQINSKEYNGLLRYGILKDRFSAIMTDAIRANALIVSNYQTQVLEFIDMDHSLKNVMIRAIKKNISEKNKTQALNEINALQKEFNVSNTLVNLLGLNGGQ